MGKDIFGNDSTLEELLRALRAGCPSSNTPTSRLGIESYFAPPTTLTGLFALGAFGAPTAPPPGFSTVGGLLELGAFDAPPARDNQETRKAYVWARAEIVPGKNLHQWRRDPYGWLMEWSAYGETSTFGWELDHVVPLAEGGADELFNLQALCWLTNRKKSDSLPSWSK